METEGADKAVASRKSAASVSLRTAGAVPKGGKIELSLSHLDRTLNPLYLMRAARIGIDPTKRLSRKLMVVPYMLMGVKKKELSSGGGGPYLMATMIPVKEGASENKRTQCPAAVEDALKEQSSLLCSAAGANPRPHAAGFIVDHTPQGSTDLQSSEERKKADAQKVGGQSRVKCQMHIYWSKQPAALIITHAPHSHTNHKTIAFVPSPHQRTM